MATRGTRAEINLDELEKLCMLHCSDKELADWFGVTTRTIERRRTEPDFAAVMDRGKSKGKISLRRAQMRLVDEGNAVMSIFLGKQWLGQTDQAPPSTTVVAVLYQTEPLGDDTPIDIHTLNRSAPQIGSPQQYTSANTFTRVESPQPSVVEHEDE